MRLPAQSPTTLLFAPLFAPSASQIAALLLVVVLLGASYMAWGVLLIRNQQTGKFGLDRTEEPRSDWRRLPELTVVGLTLMLTCLHLVPRMEPAADKKVVLEKVETDPAKPDVSSIHLLMTDIGFKCGLTAVLAAFLLSSGRSPADYGFKLPSVGRQIADGVFGYLLALLPMSAMMLATSMVRTKDNRNPLLSLLAESSDPWVIVLIVIAAVIMAPLYEELMFRVILQGWFCSLWKPAVAIPIVAVLFGAIHRMPDGIALIPLALVLGYVFDRRHSYLSVVVIHALFNATMLTLALLGQD